jgi:hypothetical protein
VKGDCVALDALGAKHDAQRNPHSFENRPLLDVKFQIGACVRSFRGSFADPFNLDVALPQSLFQANTIAVSPIAVGCDGVRPSECRGTEKTSAKTCSFFVCPIDEANRDRGSPLKVLSEGAQKLQGGENAEAAI